jgi:hypothetical protein
MLAITTFEGCDSTFWTKKSCDCVGIKRYQLLGKQCVGIRTKCYFYGKEKPCNEVFPESK